MGKDSMKTKQPFLFFLSVIFVLDLLAGYEAAADTSTAAGAPTSALRIIDFSPSQAATGSTLSIRGEGFSTVPSQNNVTLNGVPAAIISATANEIKVDVPKGDLCTGSVQVSVGDKTAVSDKPFTCVQTTVTVSTFAGGPRALIDGPKSVARFNFPEGIAIDAAGNLYVADTGNHRIRKITPQGEVSTFAGSGKVGFDEKGGFVDGPGKVAQFRSPTRIMIDAAGNLYVVEDFNLRVISPKGVVSTPSFNGDIALGYGSGVVMDKVGNLYVADETSILKITPKGEVITLAGSAKSGFSDGFGSAAKFNSPRGIAIDATGNLYVADRDNNRIRKITPSGDVSTFAGSAHGHADGTGSAAQFSQPWGIAIDAQGNLYVTDDGTNHIRKITPAGEVSSLAGSDPTGYGSSGFADGPGNVARFNSPRDIVIDAKGVLYVADSGNDRIRKIVIESESETTGGKTASPRATTPSIVEFSPSKAVYGATLSIRGKGFSAEHKRNRVTLNGIPAKIISATPSEIKVEVPRNKLCTGPVHVSVDGKTASAAKPFTYLPKITVSTIAEGVGSDKDEYEWQRHSLRDITIDAAGNLFVADDGKNRVLKITPDGKISSFAGGDYGSADGAGNAAKFQSPTGIAIDPKGIVYVVDSTGYSVRKITREGVVSTLAGGKRGTAIGKGSEAQFSLPRGITIDATGNLYVADSSNHRICKISPDGKVSIFVGGTYGDDDGTGNAAQFNYPSAITIDARGYLYVTDPYRGHIRKITPAGKVSAIIGSTYNDADGTRTEARFDAASGIAVDAAGNLYITESSKNRILRITPTGDVSPLIDNDTLADAERFDQPHGIVMDTAGNLYVVDTGNRRIRKIVLE